MDKALPMMIVISFIGLGTVMVLALIAGFWRVLEKAGLPGWTCLIPFFNAWQYAKAAKLPGWLGLLACIPYLGVFVGGYINFQLGRAFGKSTVFCVANIFLVAILLPVLGLGASEWQPDSPIDPHQGGDPISSLA